MMFGYGCWYLIIILLECFFFFYVYNGRWNNKKQQQTHTQLLCVEIIAHALFISFYSILFNTNVNIEIVSIYFKILSTFIYNKNCSWQSQFIDNHYYDFIALFLHLNVCACASFTLIHVDSTALFEVVKWVFVK